MMRDGFGKTGESVWIDNLGYCAGILAISIDWKGFRTTRRLL